MIRTIEWTDQGVVMIDQRRLPTREIYNTYRTYQEVADAIRSMVIRGAPAIGVAAAMGVALGITNSRAKNLERLQSEFESIYRTLWQTRPTAVNLFWALERMKRTFEKHKNDSVQQLRRTLVEEALAIHREDIEINRRMGRHGQALLGSRSRVLTHCNAGALATAGYGTALGVVRAAIEAGKQVEVLADETRPFLQGARLTAWELAKDNIPVTLITDNMAGYFLRRGQVDAVIVGADRIAANGDVANKIGTYSVAVLARENEVPFYVAAPISTIDLNTASGEQIPIEQRDPNEVTTVRQRRLAPRGVPAANPAFDVTPSRYVTAIITERGIARAPYEESLRQLCAAETSSSMA